MIPSAFEYYSPTSLGEALSLLSTHGSEAKLLAGGQSLLPLMKLRLSKPKVIIDIGGIPGLNGIRLEGGKIVLGAGSTYSQLEGSDILRTQCSLLPQTATLVADVQVRNQGTVGGALAHADPAADLPAAVLALDAELKLLSSKGERWIKAQDFFVTLLATALSPEEILTEIRVPVMEQAKTVYLKAAKRAEGFAIVGVAVCLNLDQDGICEDIHIGVTGVTDKAYRAHDAENMIRGNKPESGLIEEASARVTLGVDVTDDINASSEYRSHLARIYTARAVEAASRSF